MHRMTLFALFLATAFALEAAPASAATGNTQKKTPRIPVEDFFRLPEKARFRLSPKGTYVSWLAPSKPHDAAQSRLNVFVAPLSDVTRKSAGELTGTPVTFATERDITSYGWVNDTTLVYAQDQGGNENYHLFSLNVAAGSKPRDLTPFDGVRCGIEDILEDDDDHILIDMNKRDRRVFDVYRLNVNTGELTLVAENPGDIVGWSTDHAGALRLALRYDGTTKHLLYRAAETSPWQELFVTDFRDSVDVAGFTADNARLYIISDLNRDKGALFEFDPVTRRQTLLYENDEADISGIIWSRKRKKLLGVHWYTDKAQRHYFDKEAGEFYESLQKSFPGLRAGVSDTDLDEQRMIVAVASDRVPGRLYYYDKAMPVTPESFTLLADLYPWLKQEHLAEMSPISYTARDGLTIHGYLSLPVGAEPKNLPAIVVVHGGPESRDTWGYDTEAQLLANRGMAVLQVNYRVSTGYGKAFWQAGFKQWGLKQQDDITDGVRWLIARGIADPKRIAIYGGSYGGYATLMGLIKTPELYACGVDYVGVSSLFTLFDSIPPYWEPLRKQMYEKIGNPETDAGQFKATSPTFLADRIQAPLFIAQGVNDPRVVKAQSDAMVEAMKKRGVTVEYMVKDNEGHGFHNEENRFDFYKAMDRFLTKHLHLEQ